MKIYSFIILTSLILAIACDQQKDNTDVIVKHVYAKEFRTIIEKGEGQLIDIRTPGEYNVGHIQGAFLIDFYRASFGSELDRLDKCRPVYIYCRSGNRTSQAVALLKSIGFTEIVNLKYGLIDWQRNGYKLDKTKT